MTDYRVPAGESQEDQVTAAIEQYTSKTPSSAFLALAIASIGGSLACKAMGKDHAALFIGPLARGVGKQDHRAQKACENGRLYRGDADHDTVDRLKRRRTAAH